MRRRRFLKSASYSAAALVWENPFVGRLAGEARAQDGPIASGRRSGEIGTEVAMTGGGLGGCAAALAAARSGRRVVLTEETDWLGGQLTSQAVPPDEHPWIESFGATHSYRRLRTLIRQYYRDHYPLTAAARAETPLNPGGGSGARG